MFSHSIAEKNPFECGKDRLIKENIIQLQKKLFEYGKNSFYYTEKSSKQREKIIRWQKRAIWKREKPSNKGKDHSIVEESHLNPEMLQ